jgi:ribonucleoside-diphosphate reductase alpha chain
MALPITIDYSRDELLTEQAHTLMREYYMLPEEDSPQEAFARAAVAYCEGDMEFAQRIYDYASKQWFMFASPLLSNAPKQGDEVRGLPISCFLSYVPDSVRGIVNHKSESAFLSISGGGIGGHWADIRGVSKKSPGPIPFLKSMDSDILAFHQGTTRRGSYAAYMDISHPDIEEFINLRLPTGGDTDRKCFNLFPAVNVTDNFMELLKYDEPEKRQWELRDPKDGSCRDIVDARKLWQGILKARSRTGTPYINFIDTANRYLPENQRKLGLRVMGSNLCNEIHLATDEKRTAVCCLSSVNLERWDEWRDTGMVQDLVRLLDNVLGFFIRHAPPELGKAVFSAQQERSIGLGAMGFHGYLQSRGIPWSDWRATSDNITMFKYIKEQAVEASKQLARERGEAPDMEGTGMRNAHLLAIAPNANSSILCNCSASIEPIKSNAYTHRTRAGSHLIKNKELEKVLKKHAQNNKATWNSIIANEGSVQHLDFLSDAEKEVFRTAFEIDQAMVVEHAAKRQEFICQGQSVNLFFPSGENKGYVKDVHILAWKLGLKGLYYYRTNAGVTADKVGTKVHRNALKDFIADEEEVCLSCQG